MNMILIALQQMENKKETVISNFTYLPFYKNQFVNGYNVMWYYQNLWLDLLLIIFALLSLAARKIFV